MLLLPSYKFPAGSHPTQNPGVNQMHKNIAIEPDIIILHISIKTIHKCPLRVFSFTLYGVFAFIDLKGEGLQQFIVGFAQVVIRGLAIQSTLAYQADISFGR